MSALILQPVDRKVAFAKLQRKAYRDLKLDRRLVGTVRPLPEEASYSIVEHIPRVNKALIERFDFEENKKKHILVNHRRKLVVKAMFLRGNSTREKQPIALVPTYFVHSIHGNVHLVIQRLVNVNQDAIDIAHDFIKQQAVWLSTHHDVFGLDTHRGNIGLLDNKVVVFDW